MQETAGGYLFKIELGTNVDFKCLLQHIFNVVWGLTVVVYTVTVDMVMANIVMAYKRHGLAAADVHSRSRHHQIHPQHLQVARQNICTCPIFT